MKRPLLMSLMLISAFASAEPADTYIACKVLPAMINGVKDSDALDGTYTITDGGASVKIGTSGRKLPLVASDQKYEWKWAVVRDGATLTMREEINRLTGEYAMFIDGPKGTMHVSKGTCHKAEPKF